MLVTSKVVPRVAVSAVVVVLAALALVGCAPTYSVDHDLPYGPDAAQRVDVYRPTNQVGPLPAVIWLHAGGWLAGDKTNVIDFFTRIVSDGKAVGISADYRLANGGGAFPASVTDAKAVVAWVRTNAATLDVDPDRVIVAGGSAGGNLAAAVGAMDGLYEPTGYPGVSTRPSAVIDLVGPSDFTTFSAAGGWAPGFMAAYLACPYDAQANVEHCTDAQKREATVANHLDASAPPVYLLYGSQDGLVVPATQGAPLAAAWSQARGGNGVTYAVADDGHNVDPDARPDFRTWLDWALTQTSPSSTAA